MDAFQGMQLNFDVLVVVMGHLLGADDVSRVMRTCRTLYSAGVPKLLCNEVDICGLRTLMSFYRFISGSEGTRYQHMRELKLSLSIYRVEERWKSALVEILTHAQALRKLDIQTTELLDDPRFPVAISRLPNLTELFMSSKEPEMASVPMLSLMDSKVVKVGLNFICEWEDAVEALSNFSSSLEELTLGWAEFISEDVPYVKMKHLAVELWPVSEIAPLIQAYPNLRTLVIRGYEDLEREEDIREVNKSFQTQRNWKSLDSVSSGIFELYAMAISCKIRYLDVGYLQGPNEAEMLCDILPSCRPSILQVLFHHTFDIDQFPHIARTIPKELTHFVLSVDLLSKTPEGTTRVIDLLLDSLPSLSLTKLELMLFWHDSGYRCRSCYSDGNGDCEVCHNKKLAPLPMELFISAFDTYALAHRVMSSLPCLQYLHLDIFYDHRPGPHSPSLWRGSYWQAVREGDRLCVDMLDLKPGQNIFHIDFRL